MAQRPDSAPRHADVAGAVTVTNRGISLIPSFTLGKHAAIFDVAIRKHDLSFEPQFRVGLDGKPWSFIFWWRYRVLGGERFRLGVGAHPAILFRTNTVSTNGVPLNELDLRDPVTASRAERRVFLVLLSHSSNSQCVQGDCE
jgi:hypothetical protein